VKLIVGLGNPGNKYQSTRHNIGFQAADHLSRANNIILGTNRFQAVFGKGDIGGQSTIVAKPQTYMNLSGSAVGALAHYYKIAPANILVIHDDMDITLGRLKIKTQGSSAGHRGIESIIAALNRADFLRIRVGIGKPDADVDPAAFVLQRFTPAEKTVISGLLMDIEECVHLMYAQGASAAMNRFHSPDSTSRSAQ